MYLPYERLSRANINIKNAIKKISDNVTINYIKSPLFSFNVPKVVYAEYTYRIEVEI